MNETTLHIANGQVTNETALNKFYKEHKDGAYKLTTKRLNKRSNQQNRYYWSAIVGGIKDRMIELGNDVDATLVHDFLKDRFNSKELFDRNGTVIGCIGDTTTKLNKDDFGKYLDRCKQFAAEVLDIVIPDPGESVPMFSTVIATYDENSKCTIID